MRWSLRWRGLRRRADPETASAPIRTPHGSCEFARPAPRFGRVSPQQFVGAVQRERALDHLFDPLVVLHAFRVRSHVGGLGIEAEALAEPLPQSLAADRDLYGAVGGFEQPVWADEGMVVARWPRRPGPRPSTSCPEKRAHRRPRASSDARTTWPRPVRSRSCRAARTPNAPYMPASRSAIGTPTRCMSVGSGTGHRHQARLRPGRSGRNRRVRLRGRRGQNR